LANTARLRAGDLMKTLLRPPYSIVGAALFAAVVIACSDPAPSNTNATASESAPAASASPENAIVPADIKTESVAYKDGDAELEGFAVWDAARKHTRPGILVVHQWMGITDHEMDRAKRLAEHGYVAFVADIYGKGVRPKDSSEAGTQAGKFRGDTALFRSRVKAAFDQLNANKSVEPGRVAAIGYCFGGGAVLELARTGADVRGVVSFHGSYKTEAPASAETLKAKILVCHGAEDAGQEPHIPALIAELKAAKADWQLIYYAEGVHGFTHANNPERHNAKADARSWAHMLLFFDEMFTQTMAGPK
jgi:dienelactone hydrolase